MTLTFVVSELIEKCERLGHSLTLEGNDIRIENAKGLSDELKHELVSNKLLIVELLENDLKAKENGLIIGVSGTIYIWTVSQSSTAYLEKVKGKWFAWRETYKVDGGRATSVKQIAVGNTFDYVLLELKKYTDFVERNRNK